MTFNRDCFNATLLAIDELSKPEFVGGYWQFKNIKWQEIVRAVESQGYKPVDIINSLSKLKNAGFITIDGDSEKKIIRFDVCEVSYAGCLYMEENNLK